MKGRGRRTPTYKEDHPDTLRRVESRNTALAKLAAAPLHPFAEPALFIGEGVHLAVTENA